MQVLITVLKNCGFHEMRTFPVIVSCFAALFVGNVRADTAAAKERLEALSVQLRTFNTSSFLCSHPPFCVSTNKQENDYSLLTNTITSLHASVEDLVPLLAHTNAGVRTLALAAMFATDDPRMLPHLVSLAEDNAATWPAAELAAAALFISGVSPVSMKQQTVGQIATEMLSFYMKPAGYHYGVKGSGTDNPGFTHYWNARKARDYCGSWFLVRLLRAAEGTSPTRPWAISAIKRLRADIDLIPEPDRTWMLLWLNGETGSDALCAQKELVARCKALGSDKLIALLQNKIPCDDPDLQPRKMNNWPYKKMQLFILKNAAVLLSADAVPALLACDTWERDYRKHGVADPNITPWWKMAAASIQPARAAELLKPELTRKPDETHELGEIAVAIWKLCGEKELTFLADWFFTVQPDHSSFPNCRTRFIEESTVTPDPDGRRLMARLVEDKRMAQLDWAATKAMVSMVNKWTSTPIVSADDLEDAWHPYGIGTFDRDRAKAAKEHPKETADLLRNLADWRKKLAASVNSWSRPPAR